MPADGKLIVARPNCCSAISVFILGSTTQASASYPHLPRCVTARVGGSMESIQHLAFQLHSMRSPSSFSGPLDVALTVVNDHNWVDSANLRGWQRRWGAPLMNNGIKESVWLQPTRCLHIFSPVMCMMACITRRYYVQMILCKQTSLLVRARVNQSWNRCRGATVLHIIFKEFTTNNTSFNGHGRMKY